MLSIKYRAINFRLNSRINAGADLLETDEKGNPVNPQRKMPESQYHPEGKDFAIKTNVMEETLTFKKY